MGLKGKLLRSLKLRPRKTSDQTIDNSTIATKDVVLRTPNREHQPAIADPSPMSVLGLDPEGKHSNQVEIYERGALALLVPSTPSITSTNVGQVSPDNTNSTKSSSIKSEVAEWDTSGAGKKSVVPAMVEKKATIEQPSQPQDKKDMFTDIAGKAYSLMKKSPEPLKVVERKGALKSETLYTEPLYVSEKNSDQVKQSTWQQEEEGHPMSSDLPPDIPTVVSTEDVPEISVEQEDTSPVTESNPVNRVASEDIEAFAEFDKTSRIDMVQGKLTTHEKAKPMESKVSPFIGRVFNRGTEKFVDANDGENEVIKEAEKSEKKKEEEMKILVNDVANDTKQADVEEREIKQARSKEDTAQHSKTKTKGIIPAWAIPRSQSHDSRKERKVSFDDSSYHMNYEEVDQDSGSDGSSYSDYDNDSRYYDEDDDDDFDEDTYISGDSMVLQHNGGSFWGWLCGCDNINLSPGSIEDRCDDRSVGTSDTRESFHSNNYSVDDESTATAVDDEYSYQKKSKTSRYVPPPSYEPRKFQSVPSVPKMPSLLKKKELKLLSKSSVDMAEQKQPVVVDLQPKGSQGLLKKKEEKQQVVVDLQPKDLQGLPKKKETKQQVVVDPQPKDSQEFLKKQQRDPQGFPVANTTATSLVSVSQNRKVKRGQLYVTDDGTVATATTATSAPSKPPKKQGKDPRQLEIYCKNHGGVENLVLRKYPFVPVPAGRDHVLVKVEASTVSSRDCLIRIQGDPKKRPSPSVPGFQIVGTIHSLGDGLEASGILQKGDRVAALTNGRGNARYISIPASDAILLPPTATHESIICLVANYMTAYQSLKLAKMKMGGAPLTNCHVLITGGSAPVGQALIDLASREGAVVHTTAHQMHQEHLVKNLGVAWYPVSPRKWLPKLEGQMDIVVDSLCVDGYESSYKALAPGGVLICTARASETGKEPQSQNWWSDVKAKFWKNCFTYNIYESFAADPKLFQQELLYLCLQLRNGEINPKVAGRVSLNQVPKAQKLIEKGLPNGTVVLNPWKKLDPKQVSVRIEKCDHK